METQFIQHLRSLPGSGLIGDDAAVIGDRLVTVDMLTEGVDFLLAETDPKLIGRKALAVNLSDIAAMGGVPAWIFVAVALPKYPEVLRCDTSGSFKLAEQLLAGMQPLIDKYHLTLAGGDTNTWDGGLVISITVIGKVSARGVFRRSGGQPGDRILVTGKLGGSILRHQFHFEPRVEEALYLNKHYVIHAAIDISDGLSLDLHRLTEESKLGAVLIAPAIPIAEDAVKLSKQTGKPPLEHALSDGEDFELLFTAAPTEAKKLLTEQPFRKTTSAVLYDIGELLPEPGLRIITADGEWRSLPPKGFVHRCGGMTLVEVILALVILGSCVAIIGELARSAFRNARQAKDTVQAELLAESILAKVMLGIIELEPAVDIPVNMLTDRSDEIADTNAVAEGSTSDILWYYSLEVIEIDTYLVEVAVTVRRNLAAEMQPVVCRLVRWIAIEPEIEETETETTTENSSATEKPENFS